MREAIAAGLAAGLLVFCVPGAANASPITVPFYVEINSVTISAFGSGELYDPVAAAAQAPSNVAVGDRVVGSVTYDDSTIPTSGAYIVGQSGASFPQLGFVDEVQPWVLDWPGLLVRGFFVDVHFPPYLAFEDGGLAGMYAGYNFDDMYYRREFFVGTADRAGAMFMYWAEVPDLGRTIDFRATEDIHGTVYFSAPDPGSTLLLVGIGLVGLRAGRRRWQ